MLEELADRGFDGAGVVDERPVPAVVKHDHLCTGEGASLELRLGERQVGVMRAPQDERGTVERTQRRGGSWADAAASVARYSRSTARRVSRSKSSYIGQRTAGAARAGDTELAL